MTSVGTRASHHRIVRGMALLIQLDSTSTEPLHRQVYRGVREAILTGRFPAGAQVPSSRALADYLGISRTPVLAAFDQLVAEGYIVGVVGSGSYVAQPLPDYLLRARQLATRAGRGAGAPGAQAGPPPPSVADRVAQLRVAPPGPRLLTQPFPAFRVGVPPVDAFPVTLWSRLARAHYGRLDSAKLRHGMARGETALRDAIVTHHASARGVRCTAEQVIVLASAQEAMDLAYRLVLNPGEQAWFEDPGYPGARGALIVAGARVVSVPVDADGLMVQRGMALAPDARAVYITPSHQFPTGATLSLERRLQLLDWARRSDAWIVEDDYDSEYRYAGSPLTALQGLDVSGRVLYIGTFNKTVFPMLRLAYLVVPEGLIDAGLAVRRIGAQHASTIDQEILAEFLVGGHYGRHIRAMRALCRERRDALVEAAQREASGLLEVTRPETGIHLVAWLPPGIDEQAASEVAATFGVEVAPLSCYREGPPSPGERGGLVLGYGGLTPARISAGMRQLAQALQTLNDSRPAPSSGGKLPGGRSPSRQPA